MKKLLIYIFLSLICTCCTLSASQEQSLNKNLGLYLQALEKKSILVQVSMYHPEFVHYIKDKGTAYFKEVFSANENEIDLLFLDPKIVKIETKDDKIHVLYKVRKEFLIEGENRVEELEFVAISEDDGENWYFVNYKMYLNKNICKKVPRLIK
ncbi:MAG: hypothetical protein V4622_11160 [Bacteroidota bacterium]